MKVISVRQPWAWFLIHGPKRYENRDWNERYARAQLGQVKVGDDLLIHAGKGMTNEEYEDACYFAKACGATIIPEKDQLQRGGLIGIMRYEGAVRESTDPWFVGPMALKLSNPHAMDFRPLCGQLGFFEYNEHGI